MSSRDRLLRCGLLLGLLAALMLLLPARVSAQTSPFKVSTTAKGARFRVDGQQYRSEATFNWPVGSKHVLEFIVIEDGFQYSELFDVRYTFGGWADNLSLLQPTTNLVQVVTADPAITSYTATVTAEYLVRFVWYDSPVAAPDKTLSPSSCGGPGNPVPAEFRVGVIYIDGTCYWNNIQLWMAEGSHTLNAFPYPGFVFLGWKADVNPPEAFLRVFNVSGPATVSPRFSPAKRVNFRTDPPGMSVRVDNTDIRTTEIEPCEPNNLLPPGAPLTIRPMCVGEFDFALDSKHPVGAPSPQVDKYGKTWVFTGFTNGLGQNAMYVTGSTVWPEDTLVAQFVRGASVSLLTKPPGLALQIDSGTPAPVNNFVFAPGSKHTVSAPAEQSDGKGRRYRFKKWSNGAGATQEFTVPAQLDVSFILEAEYELLGQLVVSSAVKGAAITVDGQLCLLPCTVDRSPGTAVRLEAPSSILVASDQRLEFEAWSDKAERARTYTLTGTEPLQLSVSFFVSYLLRTAVDPADAGRIVLAPASPDGFYRTGTAVKLTAEPATGYRFRRWDYDAQGTDPVVSLTMDAGRAVAARFTQISATTPLVIRNAAAPPGAVDGVVAPGSLISIFGSNLAARFEVGPSGPILAQVLAGVSVTVGPRILPLLFVSPEQINAQLPRDLDPGEYELRVIRAGALDQVGKFRIEPIVPALFNTTVDEKSIAVAQHEDGSPVTLASPAKRGELITLLATGLGGYKIIIREGLALPSAPPYPLLYPIELRSGDIVVPVVWAGGQPGQAGTDAVRFRIPDDLSLALAMELTVAVGDQVSNKVLLPVE